MDVLWWEAVEGHASLNHAGGVTKGGRPWKALCRPRYEEQIRKVIARKAPSDYLSPLRYNSIKSAYYRAAK